MLDEIKLVLESHSWIYVLIRVLIIISVTVFAAKLNAKWYNKQKEKTKQFLFKQFVYNIVTAFIYIIGFLSAFSEIPQLNGLASTILAGSGIFALAISLSAQESLNNIISGLFISVFKPFEIGDRVTLVNEKITGNIEDITLRHTIIRTFTNTRIVIPNSVINKDVIENSDIINRTASSFMDVSVAYDCDIDRAMELMSEIIGEHPLYVDVRTPEQMETVPKVRVFLRDLGESGLSLRANVWTTTVNENFLACSEIRVAILKRFREEGIEIPYNKMDLYVKENVI